MLRLRNFILQSHPYRTLSNNLGVHATVDEESKPIQVTSYLHDEYNFKRPESKPLDGEIVIPLKLSRLQEEVLYVANLDENSTDNTAKNYLSARSSIYKNYKCPQLLSSRIFPNLNLHFNTNNFTETRSKSIVEPCQSPPSTVTKQTLPGVNEKDAAKNSNASDKDNVNSWETNSEIFIEDFDTKISLDNNQRLQALSGRISPELDVVVNEDNIFKCFYQNKHLSKDTTYWCGKMFQHGIGSSAPNAQEALKCFESASKMGDRRATYELKIIRSKYDDGLYSSLVQSYTAASIEIVEELTDMYRNSLQAKSLKPIKKTLFDKKINFDRISSTPTF